MLKRLSRRFRWAVEKVVPEAMIFTLLLTFITLMMGIGIADQTPMQMVGHWYDGFWNFLSFAMQMTLILLTGYCLAMAPAVQRGLGRIAAIPKTPASAVTMTALVSAVACWISWGFGLVLGPIFAREIAKRVEVDYPLLIAAAYSAAIAALVAGLTITAPITVNTPGHFLEAQIGLIPLTETIFGPTLLVTAFLAVGGAIWAFRQMLPEPHEAIIVKAKDLAKFDVAPEPESGERNIADRLNHSRIINYGIVLFGGVWIVSWFATKGFDLNLNILNFIFLMLGLALHGSVKRYADTFANGARAASGIILQFPFYAGIMGMMAGSGLVVIIAQWMTTIATPYTFGFLAMLSAGFVNIFVPSAGGQWAIQGPVLIEAARSLNVSPAVAINAFTIGDMWTNFLQPFFALPALGISGLGLKDIWGYCLVMLILFGLAGCVATLLLPLLL